MLQTLKSDFPEVQISSFPPEVMDALKAATDESIEANSLSNPLFKEVADSQREFLKQAREWSIASDFAYLEKTTNKGEK